MAIEVLTELASYRDFVETRTREDAGTQAFLSRTPLHASVIFEYLFLRSKKSMEILTGSLNPEIYGTAEVVQSAINFLSKNSGASISILCEAHIDAQSHPLLKAIIENGLDEKLFLFRVPKEKLSEYTYHFALGDQKHFRFQNSRDVPDAVVQFNDPQNGAMVHQLFEGLSRVSIGQRLTTR
jgi:hypothetical protein